MQGIFRLVLIFLTFRTRNPHLFNSLSAVPLKVVFGNSKGVFIVFQEDHLLLPNQIIVTIIIEFRLYQDNEKFKSYFFAIFPIDLNKVFYFQIFLDFRAYFL